MIIDRLYQIILNNNNNNNNNNNDNNNNNNIECLRKKLSILTEKVRGGIVIQRKITRVLKQLKCKNEADIPGIIEKIKQQIAAKSQG